MWRSLYPVLCLTVLKICININIITFFLPIHFSPLMRLSNIISLVLSASFAVHQVSCVSAHNSWVVPDGFGNVVQMISSIRVPAGSDPEGTYWMANGFHQGYLGMQRNGIHERRILFAIWDDGQGSQVDTLSQGENITVEPFGGEGTGYHAFAYYNWKTEQTVYFKLTADIDTEKNGATYTGYYSVDEGQHWEILASFFAERQPYYLEGLWGFLEDFGGTGVMREGYWGNATITNSEGQTIPITQYDLRHTKPQVDSEEWMQVVLPNNEVYQRIGGTKDEGIVPPENPCCES